MPSAAAVAGMTVVTLNHRCLEGKRRLKSPLPLPRIAKDLAKIGETTKSRCLAAQMPQAGVQGGAAPLAGMGGFGGEGAVAVGEQTGDLAKALDKAGARFEKEMDRKIQRITALIQPVIIVVIALVVGVVVYSIITSIFGAMSGMRKSL